MWWFGVLRSPRANIIFDFQIGDFMAKGNILRIKNMVAATNSVVDLFCRKFCKTCERKKAHWSHEILNLNFDQIWQQKEHSIDVGRYLMVKSERPIKQQCFAFYSHFMCHKTEQF